jgi:hypothetical protein
MISHLARAHKIALAAVSRRPIKHLRDIQAIDAPPIYRPDKVRLQETLVSLIACNHVSFSFVVSNEFLDLAELLLPESRANKIMPMSADTLRGWTSVVYRKWKEKVKQKMAETATVVHISHDGWTSPNGYGLLGIVATWLDKLTLETRTLLLGLREVNGSHTGENLATCIKDVLDEFSINDLKILGSYVADGAQNNGGAARALGESEDERVWCIGHILQLVARAIINACDDESGECEEVDLDKSKIPPIRKLRSLAISIRGSHILRQKWRQDFERMILLDNDTRWNSVLNMINSVIETKSEVSRFIYVVNRSYKDKDKKLDEIFDSDWETLESLKDILEPIQKFTLMFQGTKYLETQLKIGKTNDKVGMSDVLPTMARLLMQLNEKKKSATDRQLQRGIKAGVEKLQKYYDILCRSKVYILATVLDPRRNCSWFSGYAFKGDELKQKFVSSIVADVFTSWCHRLGNERIETMPRNYAHEYWPDPPPNRAPEQDGDIVRVNKHEFETYLRYPQLDRNIDLIKYWKEKEPILPTWAAMGFAFLTIPTMSAEVERVFSRY